MNAMNKFLNAFCILLFGTIAVYAYDFECGGLRFELMDVDGVKCVSVVPMSDDVYNQEVYNVPDEVYNKEEYIIPRYVTNPDDWQQYEVVKIGKYSFFRADNVKRIVLPESITEIGECAFKQAMGLESLDMSSCTIECLPFEMCCACESLVDFKFPQGVKFVGEYSLGATRAFEEALILPETVESVDYAAFSANATKYLDLAHVRSVASHAFGRFEEVKWSDSLVYADVYSLSGGKYTTVYLPETVKSLAFWAFSKTTKEVICDNPYPMNIMDDERVFPFENGLTLWVPEGSVDLYKSADIWNLFESIRPINEYNSLDECHGLAEKDSVEIFDLNGRKVMNKVENLPSGVYIVKTPEGVSKVRV